MIIQEEGLGALVLVGAGGGIYIWIVVWTELQKEMRGGVGGNE